MSKFIRLKTLAGTGLLLRTKWIVSVYECPGETHTRIELYNAINHAYDVVETVGEIQAMMQGEPSRPVSEKTPEHEVCDNPKTKQSLTAAVLHMMKSSQQSLYTISQKSGISQAVLTRFVNGEMRLGVRALEQLAEVLGHKITLVPEAKEST
jgi:predicted XRE-type DNA-binding protein